MENTILLAVSDVMVKREEETILWNVSLEVKKGEILAIIGPNGCGKTTLAYTLMGLSD